MLAILECFFYLKAVVVDIDNLNSVAGLIIGQNIPGLRNLFTLRGTNDSECHPEDRNGRVFLF